MVRKNELLIFTFLLSSFVDGATFVEVSWIVETCSVYSCFDKVCPMKVEMCTRQCQLALWVVRVWLSLIEVHGDSATRNEKERIRVCAVSFHHAEIP